VIIVKGKKGPCHFHKVLQQHFLGEVENLHLPDSTFCQWCCTPKIIKIGLIFHQVIYNLKMWISFWATVCSANSADADWLWI